MISIQIVLKGVGGDLDHAERQFDGPEFVQQWIRGVIANWILAPGDTIEILGNEAAFDQL